MKKFLSILLALAVGFTFTFGSAMSAFAAEYKPTDETKATLYDAAKEALDTALNDVETVKASYLKSYNDASTVVVQFNSANLAISKDAVKGDLIDSAVKAIKDKLTEVYNDQIILINCGSIDTTNGTLLEAADVIKTNIANATTGLATSDNITSILKGTEVTYTAGLSTYKIAEDTTATNTLVEAEFNVQKADAAAEIEKARAALGQYSTDVPKKATITVDGYDMYYSNYDIAKLMLDTAAEIINVDFDAATTAGIAETAAAMGDNGTFATAVDNVVYVDKNGKYFVKFKAYTSPITVTVKSDANIYGTGNLIYTSADIADVEKTLAEEKAYQIDRVKGSFALQKASERKTLNAALKTATDNNDKTAIKNINTALARIDADFAAVEEVAIAQINAEKTSGAVIAKGNAWINQTTSLVYNSSNGYAPTAFITNCVAWTENVAKLEAKAADMKAATGLDGKPVYDADAVDKALKADKEAAYNGQDATALANLAASTDLVKSEMNKVLGTSTTTVTLNKVVYPTVAKWQSDVDKTGQAAVYDEDNAEAAQAVIDETSAAIRAAKTVEDVDAAFLAGYAKFDAVPTLDDMGKFQSLKTTKDAISKYTAKLEAALTTKKADYGTIKFAKDYEATNRLVTNLVDKYLEKAYDTAGLDAAYQKALDEINNLKTKAELAAEQKSINDEVLTLKNLTLADEDKVLALAKKAEDFEDYKTLIGVTGYTTYALDSYVDQVHALADEDLQKQMTAIGTVTVEDEAAINAFVAAEKKHNENYNDTFVGTNGKTGATLLAELKVAKVKAVERAIAQIDASANPVDAAAVKAAREAYDALGETGIDSAMYAKLLSLENLVSQIKMNDETAKAYVQDLAIAARTAKVGKKVKVTINADVQKLVDNGFTVEYKFYKSTKKGSGYKNTVNKTTNTYTNTNPVKGKNYYKVKLVVKNADGTVVATTPLTQCKYGVRTIK